MTIFADEIAKQVRIDLVPQWYSKDALKVYGQISVRKEWHKTDWLRYVVKPSVAYSLDKYWSIRAGLGLLYTDNKPLENIDLNDRFEIRPFQGLTYNYKLSDSWKVDAYGRMEERFDFDTQTWDSINSLRLRLRLRIIYKFDAYRQGKYYRVMASGEGFSSLSQSTHQTDEKYRISFAVERSFSHSQKARLEMTWEAKEFHYFSSSENATYDQIYLRFIYYPTWGTLYNKLRKQEIGWIEH